VMPAMDASCSAAPRSGSSLGLGWVLDVPEAVAKQVGWLDSEAEAGAIQRQNASFPSWTSPVRFRSPAPTVLGATRTP
jgi:hypothetical protein